MFSFSKIFKFFKHKRFLIVSHELSNTGAPIALLRFAKALKDLGATIIILSYEDGILKSDFEKLDIPIFILPFRQIRLLTPLFRIFDTVICNTIVCYRLVNILQKQNQNVLWWIHEAALVDIYIKDLTKKRKEIFFKTLNECKNLYCVSEFSKSFFSEYNSNPKILNLTVNDCYEEYKTEVNNDKLTIVYIGECIPIKGQDIFIENFISLPDNIKNQFKIRFIGRLDDKVFYNKLKIMTEDCPNIEFLGPLCHNSTMKELAQADIFALFSRGDSFSIATAEALMMDKPVIISEKVGIADIIRSENCGYVISNKNEFVKVFANLKTKSLNSPREAFLKNFCYEAYKNYLKKIFSI